MVQSLVLIVLPSLIVCRLAETETFFQPIVSLGRGAGRSCLIGGLLVLPLSLLAIIHWSHLALGCGVFFSALGALWTGWRTQRYWGLAGIVLALVWSFHAVWARDLVAIGAGLGAAQLISSTLGLRQIWLFVIGFCLLDCLVISGGLVTGALHQLWPAQWQLGGTPIYDRVIVGHQMLGAGDICYAGIVAAMTGRGERTLVATSYLCGQTILIIIGLHLGTPLPATLPGLFALGCLYMQRRVSAGA